jgi:hypothetical protein
MLRVYDDTETLPFTFKVKPFKLNESDFIYTSETVVSSNNAVADVIIKSVVMDKALLTHKVSPFAFLAAT